MQTDENVMVQGPNDPLEGKEIRPIANWHEWLMLWKDETNFHRLESLLYYGFMIPVYKWMTHEEPKYDEFDRAIFYLQLADGRLNHFLTRPNAPNFTIVRDGKYLEVPSSMLVKMLHEKAFSVLCQNLFRFSFERDRDEKTKEYLHRYLFSDKFFQALSYFCRTKIEFRRLGFVNLSFGFETSTQEQIVSGYLIALAKFIWNWEKPHSFRFSSDEQKVDEVVEKQKARIAEAKLWTLDYLVALRRLDVLDEFMLKFDKSCLAKLKEIAMQAELDHLYHHVPVNRKVTSIEEANYAGSSAAEFLLLYKVKTEEQKRLCDIEDARRRRDAAEKNLKRLSGKK